MKILLVDDEITALTDLEHALKKVKPEAEIILADGVEKALAFCREECFDVIFLDINMPDKNGLFLAKDMKKILPLVNIIMVTAYPQYALDAYRLYVSDYILKPALKEDLKRALANLRNPVREQQKGLYVRCFGNFTVYYNGKPVEFGRAKIKEFFAYLIDLRGTSATNAEIRAVLWEDNVRDDEKQRKYFAQIVYEFRKKLEELGCLDIFVQSRDSYAVIPELIACDYYQMLERTIEIPVDFRQEYMRQYSWAERKIGGLYLDG